MEAADIGRIRLTVFASLMAALMAAGAYVAIPIGPVPIVLQNLFVILAGLLLGAGWGLVSVLIYLTLGILGVPVFSGGGSGLAHLAGPTGGYLLGYLPAVVVIGLLSAGARATTDRRQTLGRDLPAGLCGSLLVYAAGVPMLMIVTGMPLTRALAVGVLPFVPGDALKIAVSLPLARYLRPLVRGDS